MERGESNVGGDGPNRPVDLANLVSSIASQIRALEAGHPETRWEADYHLSCAEVAPRRLQMEARASVG